MNYPVWDVGFGLPLLIAVTAVVHVFIAHFAIGAGLFMAVLETRAVRSGDEAMLAFVKGYSRLFLVVSLVFGAITGVGIWFTIGLVQPAGTAALIHNFVWFWATEWVMFIVEITAALVYYFGWDKMPARTHVAVMWVYFIAAWGSLAVINGIVTFMLTPGGWLENRSIWAAFFNPTYLPSLITRTLMAILLAGLFAISAGTQLKPEELRNRVVRAAAGWSLPASVMLVPAFLWYRAALPEEVIIVTSASWRALVDAGWVSLLAGGLILVGLVLGPVVRAGRTTRAEAAVMLAAGLMMFGGMEWMREAARKPFIIRDYMFANDLLVADTTAVASAGYTSHLLWRNPDSSFLGRDLFRATCGRCHSLSGYNGLARRAAELGWTSQHLEALIPRIRHFRGPMPPFWGTPTEAALIADYISREAARRKTPSITTDPGQKVWEKTCGLCHTLDGFRPLRSTLSGMSAPEIQELIWSTPDLSEAMPPFLGDSTEAKVLSEYLVDRISTSQTRRQK